MDTGAIDNGLGVGSHAKSQQLTPAICELVVTAAHPAFRRFAGLDIPRTGHGTQT